MRYVRMRPIDRYRCTVAEMQNREVHLRNMARRPGNGPAGRRGWTTQMTAAATASIYAGTDEPADVDRELVGTPPRGRRPRARRERSNTSNVTVAQQWKIGQERQERMYAETAIVIPGTIERLRIATWNGSGWGPSSLAVGSMPRLLEWSPDVVCLTETWAMDGNRPSPGYTSFGMELAGRRSGGVKLLVRTALRPSPVGVIDLPGGQAVLAAITGGIVGAVYAPPKASVKELKRFLNVLSAHPGALVLGGDWNARSEQWDASGGNLRGAAISGHRRLRVAAPLGFTFTGTGGAASTVDFFVNAGAVTFTERPVVARDSFLSTPTAHRPVLADFQFRDSGGPEERHIRPSVLRSEYARERAAGLYARNLPALEQLLDQVTTAENLEEWYEMLCTVLKEPFVQCSKPRRFRPSWTGKLDMDRRKVDLLYKSGDREAARALSRKVQRDFRARERRRLGRLGQMLPTETCPKRAGMIRRALGVSSKRPVAAPEQIRAEYGITLLLEDAENDESVEPESSFRVPAQFKASLEKIIAKMRMGRAPGADGIYVEMLRIQPAMQAKLAGKFWTICGNLKNMPRLFAEDLIEPVYKGRGARTDPKCYRPITIGSSYKALFEAAIHKQYEKYYTPHPAQFGFQKGVSCINAILRVTAESRKKDGPVAMLDIRGAYPGVVRKKLIELLAKFLPPDILKMRQLLLGPTNYSVVGDPSQKKFVQRRGISQGGMCTTGDWKVYVDPLLHELDPEEKGEEATAFADDLALHPGNQSALQELLRVCERWAVNFAAKWEPTKSVVVVPPEQEVLVELAGQMLTPVSSCRYLGAEITAGKNSRVIDKIAIERLQVAIGMAARWRSAVPRSQENPRIQWRRCMYQQHIQPLADYALLITEETEPLLKKMKNLDRAAARVVLGANFTCRLPRVQAVLRLEPNEMRRRRLVSDLHRRMTKRQKAAKASEREMTPGWERESRAAEQALADLLDCPDAHRHPEPLPPGEPDQAYPYEPDTEKVRYWNRMFREEWSRKGQRRIPRVVKEEINPAGRPPRARAVRLPPALQGPAKGLYGDLSKYALRWYLSVNTPIPLQMLGVEQSVLRNLDVEMGHDEMRPAVKRSALRTFQRIEDKEKAATEWISEYRRIHDEAPPKSWSSDRLQEHLKGIPRDGLTRVR
jgi:hypothetical protein